MSDRKIPLDFTFSPGRCLRLVRNRLVVQGKTALWVSLGLWVLYILWDLTLVRGNVGLIRNWVWGLVTSGVLMVVASVSFTDIHRAPRAPWFFLLPASTLEKYVAVLVPTAGLLLVGFPLLGAFADLTALGLGELTGSRPLGSFDLLDGGYWSQVLWTLAILPGFFLGSLVFKKLALLKTVLAYCLGSLVIFLVCYLLVELFYGYSLWSVGNSWRFGRYSIDLNSSGSLVHWVYLGLVFGFLPVLFLAAGYLKLTEKEVSGGIS